MAGSPRALDNPDQARHAWRRFRYLMRWMALAAAVCAAAAIWWLSAAYGPLGWWTGAMTALGVGGSVLMASALMGLVFLSSGVGHDESVSDGDGYRAGLASSVRAELVEAQA